MEQVLLFILLVVSIAIIVLVLLQHGKGADIGAAFGSGASNTVFGSQGSASFLLKLTVGLAIVFFILCVVLTRLAARASHETQIIQVPSAPTSLQQPETTKDNNKDGVPLVPRSLSSQPNQK